MNADVKNGISIKNLIQIFGVFHFVLKNECLPTKSIVVPIKHSQPQPILPNNGESKTNADQIITTKVIAPQ